MALFLVSLLLLSFLLINLSEAVDALNVPSIYINQEAFESDQRSNLKKENFSELLDIDKTDDNSSNASRNQAEFVAECNLPSIYGSFRLRSYVFNSPTQQMEPAVIVCGDVIGKENVLVRVHDQCFTSGLV
jgi:hypothetical protein